MADEGSNAAIADNMNINDDEMTNFDSRFRANKFRRRRTRVLYVIIALLSVITVIFFGLYVAKCNIADTTTIQNQKTRKLAFKTPSSTSTAISTDVKPWSTSSATSTTISWTSNIMKTPMPTTTVITTLITKKVCDNDWTLLDGICYRVFDCLAKCAWYHAKHYCKQFHSRMAKVTSLGINSLLLHLSKRHTILVDGKRDNYKNQWEFFDGSRMIFTLWNKGEPNGWPQERCIEIKRSSSKWNDIPCSPLRIHSFACEKEEIE